jgi:lipoyl(octanoyl) transferase
MRVDELDRFLRRREEAIIAALAEEGIAARSRHREGIDYTGVWVDDRKIVSIGLHVSHGVSSHGFAVNVDNDLEPFSWMVACGLPDVQMTSIANELPAKREVAMACFRKEVASRYCRAHGKRQRRVAPARLGIDTVRGAGAAPAATAPAQAVPA